MEVCQEAGLLVDVEGSLAQSEFHLWKNLTMGKEYVMGFEERIPAIPKSSGSVGSIW